MSNLNAFIAYLEEQVKNHSIYVWGAQGQTKPTITEDWITNRETSAVNANRAIAFWQKQVKAGYGDVLRAFDCSGLGMYFLHNMTSLYKGDMSANTMMGKCGTIARNELKRGDWVFRVDAGGKAYHIGYVVDDQLNVIEAMGRDTGVVKRPLNASGASYWNAYGRPDVFAAHIGDKPAPAEGAVFAVCAGGSVYVRTGPGVEHGKLGVARKGDKLLVLPEQGGWRMVALMLDGTLTIGYMSGKYMEEV